MRIGKYPGVSIGKQIDFPYAMDIRELGITLKTTSTAGDRQINITAYDSEGTQQSQVSAYDTVGADAEVLILFFEKCAESSGDSVIITSLGGSLISVPAGGYITITDGNATDASDTLDVDVMAE